MNVERLIGGVLRGVLGGRRKRYGRTLGYLGGGRRGLSGGALLTLLGIGWGLLEQARRQRETVPPRAATSPPPTTPHAGPGPVAADPQVERFVRIAIAAARADGEIGPAEQERIRQVGRESGAEALVDAELRAWRSLDEIARDVPDAADRRNLYTLAFAIVRADEEVSAGEREWLERLRAAFAMTSDEVARLEREAVERIRNAEVLED